MKRMLLVIIIICLSSCNNISNYQEASSEMPIYSLSSSDEQECISSLTENKKIGYPYQILNITSAKQENGGTEFCLNLNSEYYIENVWFSPEGKIIIRTNYTYFLIDEDTLEYVNTPTYDFINKGSILNGSLDVITSDKYVKFNLLNLKEMTSKELTSAQVNDARCMNDNTIVMSIANKLVVENFQTKEILEFVVDLPDKNTISAFFIDKNTVVYEVYDLENLLGIGVIKINENSNKFYSIQNLLTGFTNGIAVFSNLSIKYELKIEPERQVYIFTSSDSAMKGTAFINDGQYIISENGDYLAKVQLNESFNGNMSVTVYDFKTKEELWKKEIDHGIVQSQKISLSNDGTKVLFTDEGSSQQFYVYPLN